MMNKRDFAALAAVLLIFIPSCSTTGNKEGKATPDFREISAENEAAAKSIAANFAGGFIKALETGNYGYWETFIPADRRANIDQKKFDAMRSELINTFGSFSSAAYLGRLITGKLHSYLWALSFEKGKDAAKEKFEVVYFVRVHCEKDKAPAINGFGVKLF
ncbi:MAG: hypothetical protein IJC27_08115 [Lentisphaeria bacterium]|nr:hypothetical protein [Lentisphaeria bacterium]